MAESLPTSVNAFAHRRRSRADSTTSFAFYPDSPEDETRGDDILDDMRIEDLDDVPGIGPARIEQLRDLVTP